MMGNFLIMKELMSDFVAFKKMVYCMIWVIQVVKCALPITFVEGL
jgi:hypothetical protein